MKIYTIGHSTRPFEQFVAILRSSGVHAVADVRLIPRSRKFPHFNDEFLTCFNQPNVTPFRDKLRSAGFYAEWKGKYGDQAWELLEKSVGKLS